MNFDDIAGQSEIVASLKHSIENNSIGHAYVFDGPAGIGKKTVARITAGVLLCLERLSARRCGSCISCRTFDFDSNPDFYEIESGGDAISVEQIRKMRDSVAVRPMYGNRKVYLIAGAEDMTVQAQNCLLKTLEEPPEYAVIILTVSNYAALIETIRSRAFRLSFKKNTDAEVRRLLETRLGRSAAGIDFAVSFSGGIPGVALQLAGNKDFLLIREKTIEAVSGIKNLKPSQVFKLYSFFEKSKDDINLVLDIMISFFRDMLVAKKSSNENMLINSDKKDIILDSALSFSARGLMRRIDIIESTRRNIARNVNYQLSIEMMLMKLREE